MIEGRARAREAPRWQRLNAVVERQGRLPLVLEGEHQDALQASHIDQVEAERPGARGLQTFGAVALRQPQQLLALAQLGPG